MPKVQLGALYLPPVICALLLGAFKVRYVLPPYIHIPEPLLPLQVTFTKIEISYVGMHNRSPIHSVKLGSLPLRWNDEIGFLLPATNQRGDSSLGRILAVPAFPLPSCPCNKITLQLHN